MGKYNYNVDGLEYMVLNKRDSNIELLRVLSMLLVLVVHASFKSLGVPNALEIQQDPISAFLRFTSESVSIVCVNVFVLISGWFGIVPKLNRFCEFLFQIIFYWILIYVLMVSFGKTQRICGSDVFEILKYDSYWFVRAYLLLYIISPVLNSFVNNSQKNSIELFLFLFYTAQTIFGFIIDNRWFDNGYSPLSFMGLYILARYLRTYPCSFFNKKWNVIQLYFFTMIILTFIAFLCSLHSFPYTMRLYNYSSPLVIILSVCFFYFFVDFRFSNKFVNSIAVSCFSVYLLHTHPLLFDQYYLSLVRNLYIAEPRFCFLLYTLILMLLFFAISILIDKIRILLWKVICQLYIFVKSK